MNNNVVTALQTLIVQCFLIGYVQVLVVFRAPQKKWMTRWAVIIGTIALINVLFIALFGTKLYNKLGLITLLIPYNIVTLWCSHYRDARTLFVAANSTYISSIAILNLYIVKYLLPDSRYLPFTAQLFTLGFMFLVIKRFSRISRTMMTVLHKGWFFLWLLPIGSSLASMYIYNKFFTVFPVSTFIAQYAVLLVCAGAYYTMYLFFERVQSETEAQTNQKLLSVQVSGLKSRIEMSQSAEEKMKIQRHDMRHQLSVIRELILQNDRETALAFLENSEKRLDDTFITKWCNAPILNAVFTSYFNRAEAENIHLDIKLSFPKVLSVDESELAIVFANALENAINANLELAEEKRKIKCRVITEPAMMFEISNPCVTKVKFDENNVPITKKEGHGIGMQSIVSFCKKYHATYQFEQKDDMFILRVIML